MPFDAAKSRFSPTPKRIARNFGRKRNSATPTERPNTQVVPLAKKYKPARHEHRPRIRRSAALITSSYFKSLVRIGREGTPVRTFFSDTSASARTRFKRGALKPRRRNTSRRRLAAKRFWRLASRNRKPGATPRTHHHFREERRPLRPQRRANTSSPTAASPTRLWFLPTPGGNSKTRRSGCRRSYSTLNQRASRKNPSPERGRWGCPRPTPRCSRCTSAKCRRENLLGTEGDGSASRWARW